MKVLIVGHGFVGKAVDYGFNNHSCEKIIIDPLYGTSLDKIDDINVDVSFVCVQPLPLCVTTRLRRRLQKIPSVLTLASLS